MRDGGTEKCCSSIIERLSRPCATPDDVGCVLERGDGDDDSARGIAIAASDLADMETTVTPVAQTAAPTAGRPPQPTPAPLLAAMRQAPQCCWRTTCGGG